MQNERLADVIESNRLLLRELRQNSRKTSSLVRSMRQSHRSSAAPLLLKMAEGLIAAHGAAKMDGDGATLDYIEDALRHVGERLAKEHGDGRNFKRKHIEPI